MAGRFGGGIGTKGPLYDGMIRATESARPRIETGEGEAVAPWEAAMVSLANEFVKGTGTDRQLVNLSPGDTLQVPAGIPVSRYIVQVRSLTDTDTLNLYENALAAGPIADYQFLADSLVSVIPGTGAGMSFFLEAPSANTNVLTVSLIMRSYGG